MMNVGIPAPVERINSLRVVHTTCCQITDVLFVALAMLPATGYYILLGYDRAYKSFQNPGRTNIPVNVLRFLFKTIFERF